MDRFILNDINIIKNNVSIPIMAATTIDVILLKITRILILLLETNKYIKICQLKNFY